MRIGAGIALIVAGAILAFAVRDTSDTLNLTALGIIIMLGGAAGIWLSRGHLRPAMVNARNEP